MRCEVKDGQCKQPSAGSGQATKQILRRPQIWPPGPRSTTCNLGLLYLALGAIIAIGHKQHQGACKHPSPPSRMPSDRGPTPTAPR